MILQISNRDNIRHHIMGNYPFFIGIIIRWVLKDYKKPSGTGGKTAKKLKLSVLIRNI